MNEQELIERYIEGNLSSNELQDFETRREHDPSFRKSVEYHLSIRKVITEENRAEFKDTLRKLEATKSTAKHSSRTWWAVAATLLLAVSSYFIWLQGTPSPEKLFAKNFEPYRNIVQPVVRGEVSEDLKTKAFVAYETGDFSKAALLFSELFEEENEPYALFYEANAQLATDNNAKAISLLTQYLESPRKLTNIAQWYLALAYLKEGNMIEVKERLQKIIDTKTHGHSEATEILEALK